jgi:uncharacterized protein YjbI with pentapeptide repeats
LASGGNLAGTNLEDINLRGWDLSGVNLRGANLVGADLTGAILANGDLKGANFEGAMLIEVNLQGADISYVNLWGATMHGVQNLGLVSSMDLANFYFVRGLSEADEKIISENRTVSLSDYTSFFKFFHEQQGMNKAQLSDLFLWTAHPSFLWAFNEIVD